MPLTQLQVSLGNDLRMGLYLLSDGRVVLTQDFNFVPTVEQGDICGIFDSSGFSLKERDAKEYEVYEFNIPYPYKMMPVLKAWLVQQSLIWPFPTMGEQENNAT